MTGSRAPAAAGPVGPSDPAGEGYGLYLRGAYEEALRRFSAAADMSPDKPEPHRLKGMALYRLGRYADSVESLDEALRVAKAQYRSGLAKARTLRGVGKHEEAQEHEIDAQFESIHHTTKARHVRAKALFRLGRTDDALDDLDANLRLDPGNIEVLELILQEACGKEDKKERRPDHIVPTCVPFSGRASCTLSHGMDLERMLERAEADARLCPPDADSRAEMARISSLLSMPERALDEIDAATSLDPSDAGYHAAKAGMLCGMGRMGECRGSADDALALDPQNQQAAAWKGLCLYLDGLQGDGCDMVDSAYCKSPDDRVACLCMAYVMCCEGDIAYALYICMESFREDPHDGRTRLLLGALLDEDADAR